MKKPYELVSMGNNTLNILREQKKWIFLVLLCLSQLGQLYNSQAMPTLQVPFQKEMGMDEEAYSRLVIAETLPGLLFPLIGGYLVDYFGASKSFLATNIFIVLGQSICTLAAYQKSLAIFVIGKFTFNAASETAMLARSKIVRIWYINNDLGKALSAAVVMQTGAVIICDMVYPNLYDFTKSLGFPFLMGVLVCFLSAYFCVRCINMHQTLLKSSGNELLENEGNKEISFKNIRQFPKILWILLGAASLGVDSFIIVKLYVSKFLQESYHFSIGQAGFFLAFSQVLTGIATPLAGFLTDKLGKLPIFLIISISLIQIGVFVNIIIPPCDRCYYPAIPIICMSLGLGPLFISGYSCLVRLIEEKQLGIATALIPVVISAQMIFFALISGQIASRTYDTSGYRYVFTFAFIIGLGGIFFAIWTQIYDIKGSKRLQGKSKALASSPVEMKNINTEPDDESNIIKVE